MDKITDLKQTIIQTLDINKAQDIISIDLKDKSSMAAVLTSDLKQTIEAVETLNNQGISINISNFNDGTQIVIGGLKDDIDYLKSNPIALGAKRVIPLDVAGAFHSKFVSCCF